MRDPVSALAETLATMDGNIETFWRRSHGHADYRTDAEEIMRRLARRGWRLAPLAAGEDTDPYPVRR